MFKIIDEETGTEYVLECCLLAVSKWEQIYNEPYQTSSNSFTDEQTRTWIDCMVISPEYSSIPDRCLTQEIIDKLNEYTVKHATATTISDRSKGGKTIHKGITTSESFYALMALMGIPFEAELWHINRLQMLIEVMNAYSSNKPMTKEETLLSQRELNEARRAALNSKG